MICIFPGSPLKFLSLAVCFPHTPVPADLPSGTVVEHRFLPGDQLNDLVTRYNNTLEGIITANPEIAELS